MEHLISRILIRKFRLPKNFSFTFLKKDDDSFDFNISLNFKNNYNDISLDIFFERDKIFIEDSFIKSYDKEDIDFKFIEGLRQDRKDIGLIVNEHFKDILVFKRFNSATKIKTLKNDILRIVSRSQSQYVMPEHTSKTLYLELEKEVLEYHIRDYVFIETGMIIHKDEDMDCLIRAFYGSNSKISIDSKKITFSDEFKSFINFYNKDEYEKTIELLNINYKV